MHGVRSRSRKDEEAVLVIKREFQLLRALWHPAVVRALDCGVAAARNLAVGPGLGCKYGVIRGKGY